jgi:hypothetical protein
LALSLILEVEDGSKEQRWKGIAVEEYCEAAAEERFVDT